MERISIVIPMYNEAHTIRNTLLAVSDYASRKKFEYEIIAVDDGSTDGTIEEIHAVPLKNITVLSGAVNRGKGHAVKRGVLAARKEWVLFTDADLSTPIEELENFFAHREYDVIIGSRALPESRLIVRQPRYRELGGRLLHLFIRRAALPGIRDSQCGFKLFQRTAAREIFTRLTIDRWGFDVEALYIARQKGYTIKELPISWRNSPDTKVRPFRDGIRIMLDLLKIRINDLRNQYE